LSLTYSQVLQMAVEAWAVEKQIESDQQLTSPIRANVITSDRDRVREKSRESTNRSRSASRDDAFNRRRALDVKESGKNATQSNDNSDRRDRFREHMRGNENKLISVGNNPRRQRPEPRERKALMGDDGRDHRRSERSQDPPNREEQRSPRSMRDQSYRPHTPRPADYFQDRKSAYAMKANDKQAYRSDARRFYEEERLREERAREQRAYAEHQRARLEEQDRMAEKRPRSSQENGRKYSDGKRSSSASNRNYEDNYSRNYDNNNFTFRPRGNYRGANESSNYTRSDKNNNARDYNNNNNSDFDRRPRQFQKGRGGRGMRAMFSQQLMLGEDGTTEIQQWREGDRMCLRCPQHVPMHSINQCRAWRSKSY